MKRYKWISVIMLLVILIGCSQPLITEAVENCGNDVSAVKSAMDKAVNYLLNKEKTSGVLSPWSYIAISASGRSLENTLVDQACEQLYKELEMGETNTYSTLVLTLVAAGKDPENYKGQNLVQKIKEAQLANGKYADFIDGVGENLVNTHIWAVIALYLSGVEDQEKALDWLLAQQHADGSFHWDANDMTTQNVDVTGMALTALGVLGETKDSPSVQRGIAFLRSAQKDNGGYESWGIENPESCNQVIQGLIGVGINPYEWIKPGGSVVQALMKFQLSDGSFSHTKGGKANEMATQQAIMALSDVYYGKSLYERLRYRPVPAPSERCINFHVGQKQYTVEVNGTIHFYESDAVPFVENGRTYVPVRYMAYALGISDEGIKWEPETKAVILSEASKTVKLIIGSKEIYYNGSSLNMDVAPVLRQGRTYLPARYVAEAFGFKVEWDGKSKAVIIKK